MWKGRPVIASAVGGIRDQIVRGRSSSAATRPSQASMKAPTFTRIWASAIPVSRSHLPGLPAPARTLSPLRTSRPTVPYDLQEPEDFSVVLGSFARPSPPGA